MVLGMETKSFVWVVWIQVWNLSKMYGYMFGWYGFKYGICLKCMDTCLGGMDSCRNLTLTPFFDEFWV